MSLTSTGKKPAIAGVALVAGGALLLSTKGIFAKLLYARDVDYTTVATVRALLALPVFWIWGLWRVGRTRLIRVPAAAMVSAAIAGFACYYAGALLDFYALTLIDASLERVLLFTYPALVVIAQSLIGRHWPATRIVAASAMTYGGIVLVVGGLDRALFSANLNGTVFVLICAATLAFYFIVNERVGRDIGSVAFTVYAMTAAAAGLMTHFAVTYKSQANGLDAGSWQLLIMMVAVATVLPLFMVAEGVKTIGAQRGALISTVGPPSTIVIAWLILGETMALPQLAGTALVLGGIVILELRPSRDDRNP